MSVLLRIISPIELEYALQTNDGTEYDVLLEISYDSATGKFYPATTFFYPDSAEIIKKSSLSTPLLMELSQAVNLIYESYLSQHRHELKFYFKQKMERRVC